SPGTPDNVLKDRVRWFLADFRRSIEPLRTSVCTTVEVQSMSRTTIDGFRIAGVATCVPPRVVNNLSDNLGFDAGEVRKVVAMAGVRERRVVDKGVTSGDLCYEAADSLLQRLGWQRDSVTGLIFVTQTPDYWLPSTSCVLQERLGLSPQCGAFDVGLGCSGYPYGLYLA